MENKAQKPDEIDLIKVFALLWEKRKLIAITTFVFALLGFIYAFVIATPMYKSTITLYPATQEKGSSSQLMQMASQFGFGGMSSSSNNYNIPDVVKSRRILKKIIEKNWETNKFPDKKNNLIEFWEIDAKEEWIRRELAIKKLSDLIFADSNNETGLIKIKVLTEEAQLSADIVNYIGEAVTAYIQTEQKNKSSENRVFIEQRLEAIKRELSDAEVDLREFRGKNRNVSDSPTLQLEYARLQRQVAIKQEVFITLEKQRELAMIEEVKDTPIINMLDVGEKAIMRAKPRRGIIIIMSIIGGLIISLLF
ncbi:MAG: hypothetical protein KAS49_07590, partial [Candidatus Cloacimonetes bacterium]|nr:hypothetical protein [Candidatus Cloacimonadota bacterium]